VNRKRFIVTSLIWTTLIASPQPSAQPYPAKPIRFIVPYPPGGGTDLFARTLGAALSEALGQQVVVENRAGAQGSVAIAAVAKAPADGYTILLSEIGSLTMNPWLYENTGYDPVRDFAQISLGVTYPNAVVVHPGVPAKSLKELSAIAKAKPDLLTFASAGALSQLTGELFKVVAGVKILHVPYKGAGPATIDLVGGQIDVMYATAASAIPMVKAGKTRAIAVTGPQRIPALPDVLTSKESGFSDFEVLGWFGVAAPGNTPRDVVVRLNREIRRMLATPAIIEKLVNAGLESKSNSPEEMTELVKSDYARWGKVVKTVGIKPQ
jgi:tripartite-type tricarboxylate transporter receptor subunit TctC